MVARAFGGSLTKKLQEVILLSHRVATWGRPGAFLSNSQRLRHPRKQRKLLSARDVQLRQEMKSAVTVSQVVENCSDKADIELRREMNSAVTLFRAGKDVSDGAAASKDASIRHVPQPATTACATDVDPWEKQEEINAMRRAEKALLQGAYRSRRP